jgi:hypothetical protein
MYKYKLYATGFFRLYFQNVKAWVRYDNYTSSINMSIWWFLHNNDNYTSSINLWYMSIWTLFRHELSIKNRHETYSCFINWWNQNILWSKTLVIRNIEQTRVIPNIELVQGNKLWYAHIWIWCHFPSISTYGFVLYLYHSMIHAISLISQWQYVVINQTHL